VANRSGEAGSRNLQSIQALRALAASTVILAHVPFVDRGVLGVDIFFVISGFIMCYVSALNPDQFLLKRMIRIVPLYWVGTLGVFSLALVVPRLLHSTTASPVHLLKSLFFIPYDRGDHSIEPMLFLGWTLEYEMFFYLVFASALAIGKAKAGLVAIAFLVVVVTCGQLFHPTSVIPRFFSRPIILEFGLGIVAFLVWRRWGAKLRAVPLVAAVLVAAGCYSFFFVIDKAIPASLAWLTVLPPVLLRGGLAFAIIMSFLSIEGRVAFPAFVLLLGDASYSLYLFHPYIVQFASKTLMPFNVLTPASLAVLLGTIGVCFLFAVLSFRLLERPSNEYLRRLLSRRQAPRVTPAVN
jgi:exopolysaccharide production protein ExoZ